MIHHKNLNSIFFCCWKYQEISIEFTAHDPIERDFHGIRCLLQQLWLKENIDISELTELVMKDTITTVIKVI